MKTSSVLAAACTLLIAALTASAGSTGSGPLRHAALTRLQATSQHSSGQVDSNTMWRGDTLGAWTARSWQWFYSIPNAGPLTDDLTGANCGINQRGPVWFLTAPLGNVINNACTVPAGKGILSAVVAGIDDYPCPDPGFGPALGQSMESFLLDDIGPFIDSVTFASATLDNRPLAVHRVKSPLTGFTSAASNIDVDPCITGSPQVGVSDGYFVFINPLSPGQHTLRLQSAVGGGPVTDVTTVLTVR